MSALWDAIIRRLKHTANFVCPFFNTDYDYGPSPTPSISERDPISEQFDKPKEKHVRRTEEKEKFVVEVEDDEAGFSSKSTKSDSQCESLVVENSEEIRRIEMRKAEFLPAKPYQPVESPVPQFRFTDDMLGFTEPVSVHDSDTPIDPPYNVPRVKTPVDKQYNVPRVKTSTSPEPRAWSPDSASAYSKQSKKRSIFGKKKKGKGDGDNVSMISFKSIKSRISLNSNSSKLDKKDRKRIKEEKKERKTADKQPLNLGTLGNHHLENMYPWMNEMEELDDEELEGYNPNVIEEIRIKEAMEIQERIQREAREEEPSIIDPVEPSIMDLASQMMPISQMTEPTFHNPNQNKFGVPEGTLRRPLVHRVIDVGDTSEHGPPRLRQLSSDPETDGVIRKSRAMNSEKSVSITMKTPGIAPGFKRTPSQPVLFKKKDIFASNLTENMDDKDSIPEKIINKSISEKYDVDYSKINHLEIEDYSNVSPETPPVPPRAPSRPRPVSPVGPEYAMPPRPKREELKPLVIRENDPTLEKNAKKIQSVSPEDRPARHNRKPSPEPENMKPYAAQKVTVKTPEPIKKPQKRVKTPEDPLFHYNLPKSPTLPPRDPPPKLKHVVERVKENRKSGLKLKEVVENARAQDRKLPEPRDIKKVDEQKKEEPKVAKVIIEKKDGKVQAERIVVSQELAENRLEYFKLDQKAKEVLQQEDKQDVMLKHGGESGHYIPGIQSRVRRDSIELGGERRRHRRKGVESERGERKRRSPSPDQQPRDGTGRRVQSTRDRPARRRHSRDDGRGFSSDEVKKKKKEDPIVQIDIADDNPDAIYKDLGLNDKPAGEETLRRRRRRRRDADSDYAKSENEIERRRSRRPREDVRGRRRSSSVVQSEGEGRRRRRFSEEEDGRSERRRRIDRLKSPEPNRERRSSRKTPDLASPGSPASNTEVTAVELDGRKSRRDDRDRSRRSRSTPGEGRRRESEERRSRGEERSKESAERRSIGEGDERRPMRDSAERRTRSNREPGVRRLRHDERKTRSHRDGGERRDRKDSDERRSRKVESERRPRRSSKTPDSSIPPTPEGHVSDPLIVEKTDEQIRLEVIEKRRLELVRKKMDLDFQSVDTKRSVFVIDDVKSDSSSKRELWEKKQKMKLRPSPKGRARVHTRPSKLQEERSTLREIDEVSEEKDKSSAGSTLHSGDVAPLKKAEDSDSANDSTLKDIGDIPSEWNASQRTRAKSIKSVQSTGSAESRITHRSQISLVSGRKVDDRRSPTKIPKLKKDLKKKKKKK